MAYQMVPVPEDLVPDAMRFVVRMLRQARATPWTAADLGRLLDEADPTARRLAVMTADAVVNGRQLQQAIAAHALDINERTLVGLISEVNGRATELERPRLFLLLGVDELLPDGTAMEVPCLTMEPENARLVLAADPS